MPRCHATKTPASGISAAEAKAFDNRSKNEIISAVASALTEDNFTKKDLLAVENYTSKKLRRR